MERDKNRAFAGFVPTSAPSLSCSTLAFQNHPQRYEKRVSYYSDTAMDRWLERDLNSHLRVFGICTRIFVDLNWIRLATNPR